MAAQKLVSSFDPIIDRMVEALGIQNRNLISEFFIHVKAGEIVSVNVCYCADNDSLNEFTEALESKRFTLVEVIDADSDANVDSGTFHSDHDS